MTKIQQECIRRNITRLCHFTQSRNLAHILGDYSGILSRSSLESGGFPHNPTDPNRWDGCENLICCTIEFPNVYYFDRVRDQDHLFKDWVVLLIKPDLLWGEGTKFCPCNAATAGGAYIDEGYEAFRLLFVNESTGRFIKRSHKHLPCMPTDIQAEVLVPDPIDLNDIIGFVVEDDEQAKRELCRAKIQRISIDKKILIVPDFYRKSNLAGAIQNGRRVAERIFDY